MKTLYNKALLYQYYHSGKWALFLGAGAFGAFTYMNLNNEITFLKRNISSLESDKLISYAPENIISLFFVLFLVYMMITGINKRNNLTFLTCGPYSKEEIKKNQSIFLFGSLLIFVFIYAYINFCVFYREQELLMLADKPVIMLLRNIFKMVICGLAFGAYLLLMDCLFSNIGMMLFMLIITPIVFVVDNVMIMYLGDAFKSYSIVTGNWIDNFFNYIFYSNINQEFEFSYEIGIIICILFITIIAFSLTWIINKKLIINNINKLFCFPIVEKIFYWVFSFSVLLLISTILIFTNYRSQYVQDLYFQNGRTLKGTIIVTLVIVVIAITATFMEKVIRKFMKRFI
ncbi:hypothetical protein NNC19_02095 [Clostridium sp. SHJSY1]|uniref:hypothetical protein n=1 Tax=Clostridium sp. SHJSY1 TaxID=2942483 RepID=UPI0028747712|nr:hypothetical protein [Clostridium sp. SHJSY1]MDS0524451.1 hypothetical protein [Clostridium sp. SHJSY1]